MFGIAPLCVNFTDGLLITFAYFVGNLSARKPWYSDLGVMGN